MNYYELLEIREDASDEVIKMAYKALLKKYHPDVFDGDKAFAEEKTKKINEAYEVLSDPVKRQEYDLLLKQQRNSQNQNEKKDSNAKTMPTKKASKTHKLHRYCILFIIVVVTLILAVLNVKPEYKYNKACENLDNGLHNIAIEQFEELDGYKDSENKINEAKYRYVLTNRNNKDATTFIYLKDLKEQDYKDSSNIYEEIYDWKIKVVAVNSSEDDETTTKESISKYESVYFHLKLTGGTPDSSVRVTVKSILPNGNFEEYTFDEEWVDNDTGWYGWYESVYQYPQYGTTGTLQCKFYDDSNNLIGVGSILITD